MKDGWIPKGCHLMNAHTFLEWVALAALIVGCSPAFPRTPDRSGSHNEIDDLQLRVAARIVGASYASGDVAFSISTAQQVLAVELHNFRSLEDTCYLLADCTVTVIADDDRAFVAGVKCASTPTIAASSWIRSTC